MITNCRLYSHISQILMLYKTWGYYIKFDSTISLGVYYWCVRMTQCVYITFYVQNHIAVLAMCYNPSLVRDKPLGAPAFMKLVSYVLPHILNKNISIDRQRFLPQFWSSDITSFFSKESVYLCYMFTQYGRSGPSLNCCWHHKTASGMALAC